VVALRDKDLQRCSEKLAAALLTGQPRASRACV
jgi:hypothetical protein